MSSDAPSQEVHEAFTRLMRWAYRGDVRRTLVGAAADALSINDITLLRAITAHGPVRISDLASWQGVDKSTVTPQVRRLEERDMVSRQSDPADRRATLLTLTEHGRQTLRNLDEAGRRLFGQALEDWSDADRHTLAALMQRLAAELDVGPRESAPRPGRRH